ncbi:hypothetical protein ABZV78_22785 [Micromonospora sp. NPDC004540]
MTCDDVRVALPAGRGGEDPRARAGRLRVAGEPEQRPATAPGRG